MAEIMTYMEDGNVHIVEAREARFDWRALHGSEILEALDEHNDELAEPDSDGGGFFEGVTPEQERDLEAMVAAAIEAWAEKHNIVPYVWAFGETRNVEWVVVGAAP